MKTIHFKDLSPNLSTRNLATKVRQQVLCDLRAGEFLAFDFSGVNVISNSFADECFGKLLIEFELKKIQTSTTFKNINPLSKQVIAYAFKQRLFQLSQKNIK